MASSQFEAKTYGVGELITQRKLFRVPHHQRNYAWEVDVVKTFLDDVLQAHKSGASDYFIGLVVTQGPQDGEWILLDGQQRLTTASLVFAAIRYWFSSNGFEADADQINNDYLSARRLGGEQTSRMQMNLENQGAFVTAAIQLTTDEQLRRLAKSTQERPTNRLLYKAAIECREWVTKIAEESKGGVDPLYSITRFIDSRVKVVCVDVSSEVDAYILFESLNDRGMELSALDLIKNHIASKVDATEGNWSLLLEFLADFNPDDFLKIFWTSRYGLTQKSQLFKKIKESYSTKDRATKLMMDLLEDAEALSALYDGDHPYWARRKDGIYDLVSIINVLGARQVRPAIISALRTLVDDDVEKFIWMLIVSVVRFQIVGKGHPAVVEQVISRMCQLIHSSRPFDELIYPLSELSVTDEVFEEKFRRHTDRKYSRTAYLQIEVNLASELRQLEPCSRAKSVCKLLEETKLVQCNSESSDPSYFKDRSLFLWIGNFSIPNLESKDYSSETERADDMAMIAPSVWPEYQFGGH